ncbi:MAG: hypothetical protein P1P64_01035 [Treponemataceae bacterium]
MKDLKNLLGGVLNTAKTVKSTMDKLNPEKIAESKNMLTNLASGAFSELTNNVDLLKSIDLDKPVKATDAAVGNIVKKIKTTAMSKLLKTGEKSMAQGVLQQLSGAFGEKSSSIMSLLPMLIENFDKLKAMFSEKSETAKPKTAIKNLLDKAGPALDLLKALK